MGFLKGSIIDQGERLLEERLGARVRMESGGSQHREARFRLVADDSGELEFEVEVKNKVGELDVEDIRRQVPHKERPLLLVSPRLSVRVREKLRSAHVNHMDLSGNLFIREPGLYVWLEADRKPPPLARFEEERTLNPFSKKASLVLRALLEAPENAWGVRELSAEIRLSLGHTSDIARTLVERGYAGDAGGKIVLRDPVGALRDWLALYNWKRNSRQSFLIPFGQEEMIPKLKGGLGPSGVSYGLTLLAGAGLVAPHVHHDQTHLYVSEPFIERAAEIVTRLLFGEPAPVGGNLHLMLPYYGEATFYGRRELEDVPVVSNVQLFLDLAGYSLRGPEAARMLVKGPLARQLSLDRSQVKTLISGLD